MKPSHPVTRDEFTELTERVKALEAKIATLEDVLKAEPIEHGKSKSR
jgi:hypothetical protein